MLKCHDHILSKNITAKQLIWHLQSQNTKAMEMRQHLRENGVSVNNDYHAASMIQEFCIEG